MEQNLSPNSSAKSVTTVLVIILLLILGAGIYLWQSQNEQSESEGQEGDEGVQYQFAKPQIIFKPAMKYKVYEDNNVSFGLYYESELGAFRLKDSNLIEIYDKNSPGSKDLAGGDIDVQLFLNQPEGAYDRHIKSIEDQNLRIPGGKGILYREFPESDKELRDIKAVQYLYYPAKEPDDGTGTAIYFVSFKEDPAKKNYVTIKTVFDAPKRYLEVGAILDTIVFK